MDTSNVPKFTSFRPKPKPEKPGEVAGGHDRTHQDERNRDRRHESAASEVLGKRGHREGEERASNGRRRHHHDDSPPRHSKHDRRRDDRYDRHSRKEDRTPYSRYGEPNSGRGDDRSTAKSPVLPNQSYSDVCFVDRKGDPDNLKYGYLNQYRIPSYRRYGSGRVLGVPVDYAIDRKLTTDKETIISVGRLARISERPLTSKRNFNDQARSLKLVHAGEQSHSHEHMSDFLPFSATGKRKRGKEIQEQADYRFSGFNEHDDEPSDSDAQYESERSSDELEVNSEVTQKNAFLTQKTRENPTNPQVWLDLIHHQEAMIGLERTQPSQGLSGTDKRNLADIKISIYEQALKKVKQDNDQLLLVLGLMTEASKDWDSAKLAKKWKEVLARFPHHSMELWIKYLDYVQSSFGDFKYETCRDAFKTCLKTIGSVRSTNNEHAEPRALEEMFAYVLTRITLMMKSAGYQEQAVAIWQAVLEFHCFRPKRHESLALEESLKSFEEFWESEVPRIGEPKSKGWKHSDVDEYSPPVPVPSTQLLEASSPTLKNFSEKEQHQMNNLSYPGRSNDDVGEDDPFHLVLFSDIEEYLQLLPREVDDKWLVQGFLCFNELPPLSGIGEKWWLDPFLRGEIVDQRFSLSPSPFMAEEYTPFLEALRSFMACPMPHFQMSSELLFDYGFVKPPNVFDADFIRHALKLLALRNTDSAVAYAEYLLAFELKYFPSDVARTAKQLLKVHSSSLLLYNAYGLVESRRGNSEKADHVFNTALTMNRKDDPFSQANELDLFYSLVWEAMRRNDTEEALRRLVSLAGHIVVQNPHDSSCVLRAQTRYTELRDDAVRSNHLPAAIRYNSLLTLLTYLLKDCDISSALAVFAHFSITGQTVSGCSLGTTVYANLHAQCIAQLLTYHVTHTPIFKPSFIRTQLEPLIHWLPDNTILLALYAANEARFRIDDHVRSIMHEQLTQPSKQDRGEATIVEWFFALFFEMERGATSGSTSHSIRALFKKAEESDVGSKSAALWTSHLLFELTERDKLRRRFERSKNQGSRRECKDREETFRRSRDEASRRVKDVFFTGLRHLPWSKTYMMRAFDELKDVLSEEEKRRVYNVMVEKEMRIYVELDTA